MKISASRISSPLKEYNIMRENLLQKFKRNPVLENPLLCFIGLTKTTQSCPLTQKKHWEEKSENNLD